ncbi:MAG: ketoacyl-ACP synthase III [Micavibrio aeruginosavorus]|uniref:Beta-ketoacyl-[acyl-carrier-protein] synthase III n=1 Tax=Micavibrio aeruginosavorus TaxID=349221 RepID=A0A7T5R4G5_9BACT|nr:MAG: ketoacyl-ACP synthase III [Micavibrio aeruginosavorus]
MRSVILGTGSCLPERTMTNKDLEAIVDTSDEWIVQRTGIRERRIAADGQTTADMAIESARHALQAAGLHGADIDGVIVATSTPDTTFPSVAVKVQAALNICQGPAFDVHAVCAGFIYALTVADSLLRTGVARRLLVVGAEKMSSILNWEDRTTCVLFGDGAGALVLEAQEGRGEIADRGIISTHLHADGHLRDILYVNGGVSSTQTAGHIVMEGKEVFRHAVALMADVVTEAMSHNGIGPEEIDWLVPHQANIRIIEGTARKLDVRLDQVILTVDRHGNTSAASIPLALDEAVRDGRIQRGHLMLLEALGSGLTWGAALIRY